jgi:hypothetical protein
LYALSSTGLSPTVALCSKQLRVALSIRRHSAECQAWSCNPSIATAAALARCWFGLIPVRSPLLRDCYLFLGVHKMVQFPRFPPSCDGHSQRLWGCPIRRSWAHSLHAAPPRVSSLSHVLHRHAAPRHPPYAHCVFPAGIHEVMLDYFLDVISTSGQKDRSSTRMHLSRYTCQPKLCRGAFTPEL